LRDSRRMISTADRRSTISASATQHRSASGAFACRDGRSALLVGRWHVRR
jgi:hypothetical protein